MWRQWKHWRNSLQNNYFDYYIFNKESHYTISIFSWIHSQTLHYFSILQKFKRHHVFYCWGTLDGIISEQITCEWLFFECTYHGIMGPRGKDISIFSIFDILILLANSECNSQCMHSKLFLGMLWIVDIFSYLASVQFLQQWMYIIIDDLWCLGLCNSIYEPRTSL